MPLSPSDRYYRAEATPASISQLGAGLRTAYAQPADAFGAKGNTVHTSGYHRSRAWILHSPDSRYGASDYSVRQALDLGGSDDDVSAFDFTPADWGSTRNRQLMVDLTARVHTAAKARDPRLANLREFAGTLDGRTVVTFNCADGSFKTPFDPSHLDHVHGSFWRSRAANDHAGLLAVLLGDDMADITPQDTNAWHEAVRIDAMRSMKEVNALGEPMPIVTALNKLLAAAAADEVRDAAFQAALTAAGGDLETAAVIQAVKDATETTHTYITQLQADLTAAEQRNAELRERLAAAIKPQA